ncbi:hypothetical protein HY837_00045 [archaeon]|nr:hypothetical protein [archaeon]
MDINKLKTLTEELITHKQNVKLRATVRYLLSHTKVYKEIFEERKIDWYDIQTIDDWTKLPLVTKKSYLTNPEDFIVKVNEDDAVQVYQAYHEYIDFNCSVFLKKIFKRTKLKEEVKEFFTPKIPIFSGGTEAGKPSVVFMTEMQRKQLCEDIEIIMKMWSNYLDRKIIGMNLFPYGPHLAWQGINHAFDEIADMNLCTAAGRAMSTEQLIKIAKNFQPNMFAGMNSYFRQRFLPEIIKQKIKLPEKIIFVNGAEKLLSEERKQIKELSQKAGVKELVVLDMYGASELKSGLMAECKENSGFHQIQPFNTILKTVECGEERKGLIEEWEFKEKGYSVLWNLDGAGTKLEGYLLGDVWEITNQRCNCGLSVPTIKHVDRIRNVEAQLKLTGIVEGKVKGTRINLSELRNKILGIKEVTEVQVVAEKNKLRLYIIGNKKVKSSIEKVLKGEELKPEIKFISLDSLEKGKLKFEGIIIK